MWRQRTCRALAHRGNSALGRWAVPICTCRRSTTSSPVATTTPVSSMKDFGFQHSTPNFNLETANVPSDADLGDVVTTPARQVAIEQLNGPWLVMAEGLHGELFVERDGCVLFRPAAGLGYGVGRVKVIDSSIGLTTFQMQLEVYLYENVAASPPLDSKRFDVVGTVSTAKASKSMYETLTLHGRDLHSSSGGGAAKGVSSFNAAKLTPWSPATALPPTWKGPSAEVREGFTQLFPDALQLSSHLQRRSDALAALGPRSPTLPLHMDLTPYKVGSVSNVYYIPNYLNADEQEQMMQHLQNTPDAFKTKLTKRTCQEWGCTMCPTCQTSFVSESNLPPWVEAVSDMLVYDGIHSPTMFPNSVRIHEYEVGEGIAPHCDGPIYCPKVSILSLASTSVMHFYNRRDPYDQPMEHYNDTFRFDGAIAKERPLMSVVMEPGSLLIFERDVYTHHPHGISGDAVDSLDPSVAGEVVNRHLLSDPNMTEVVRKYRVGVTIRNLLPRCNHEPERVEHYLKRAWGLYQQSADVGYQYMPQAAPPSLSASDDIAAPMPSQAVPSSPSTGVSLSALEAKVDKLLANQAEILRSVQDLQRFAASAASSQETFQRETSTVLNHLTSTVLQIENVVEELTDEKK